ncbi:MAG: EAL domain-containing protein [Desulfuromusa sp.]|nr:EAL domain-containing protein [Desulfuromusa sp.]
MTDTTHSNKPLILVVDDDLATRLLMRASLEKAGYRVEEAEDGLVAVAEFEQLKPDVILLDVMMPKLDGFDTCRAIRKLPSGEHTPVLMVTGLEDIDSIHRSFESGATDFTTKPINWTVLNYRVKYMLRASEAFYDVIDKQKQIQELAFFDQLTGLANRTMFMDTLEITLAKSVEEETLLGVLFLDLDRFKTINDTLGHQAGDILLKNVAERISTSIRESDPFSRVRKMHHSKRYISRIGGDEFTIMLPNLKAPEDAGLVAKRINKVLTESFQIDDHEVFISASIGISVSPYDGSDAEVLMKHADLAMYHAKERGKNGFQFYTKSLNVKAKERLEFENDVRKAVKNEEFTLFYQPQISIVDGSIIGAEALTRWKHESRGMVSPAEFIPAIEELGLIIPFTDWVISQTGKQQAAWQQGGLPTTRVAINISSKNFIHQNIPGKITEMLQVNNLNPQFLELELTESVLAEQSVETIAVLQQMKDLGLSISVDDFGTGYSSLVYLKAFPIDILKIDRFFIKDILTSHQDAAIVKAIIAMAQSMEIKVVAEGIEEKEQFDLLQKMGCDYGQGFLFSPAVQADKFATMIRNGASLVS